MQNTTTNGTENVLTDFTVPYPERYVPSVDYVSPAQYRLVDLIGHNDIKNIQIAVYWKNIYNALTPVMLSSGCDCNMKIVFIKRSFFQ